MIIRRGFPFSPVVLAAVAVAILVAAALTSSWMLLALIPLVMMVGCMAMMATHPRVAGRPSAPRFGCCGMGPTSAAPIEPRAEHSRAGGLPGASAKSTDPVTIVPPA